MLRVPMSAPADAGLKATKNEQDAPAASAVPQLPSSRNEVALVPPSAMELMVTATVLVFLSVIGWASLVEPSAVLGNAIAVGVRMTVGVVAATPVPARATVCG